MINVIGLGYIGLPTALMLANNGVEVVGTDYNKELINNLSEGKVVCTEEGLKELFRDAIERGIKFTTEYQESEIYIISVPTPYIKENKKIDVTYVINAVNSVLDKCPKGATLIIESTISPGTIDKYIRPEVKKHGFILGKDIHLVHAPERIIPGNMVHELINNSRTIGCDNKEIGSRVKEIYSRFCKAEIIITDIKSAEMSKVVENTYRDINIAFANELARICHEENMDVYNIIKIANRHPRVNILQPGPGVGGHCISVDPWFLVGDYPDLTQLILSAREVNDSMPLYVLSRIKEIMKENNISDFSKVGIYGLTYKENVDDIRESPTLQLIEKMREENINEIKVYDPFVKKLIIKNQYNKFQEFIDDVEVVIIMVAHNHIKNNLNNIKNKIVLDTKNICNFSGVYKL